MAKKQKTKFDESVVCTLKRDELRDYRDRLRKARYAALADAEGFSEICFTLEQLGVRLTGKANGLGNYLSAIEAFVPSQMTSLAEKEDNYLSRFSALFEIVRNARNDAMHTGAYARHVTQRAIELCILLEDGLMPKLNMLDSTVGDYMVKEAIWISQTQPMARARQLMLTHSFSNLPVNLGEKWYLLTEMALARYLAKAESVEDRYILLGRSVAEAYEDDPLLLKDVNDKTVNIKTTVRDLMLCSDQTDPMLWLVVNGKELAGVISPFELM